MRWRPRCARCSTHYASAFLFGRFLRFDFDQVVAALPVVGIAPAKREDNRRGFICRNPDVDVSEAERSHGRGGVADRAPLVAAPMENEGRLGLDSQQTPRAHRLRLTIVF